MSRWKRARLVIAWCLGLYLAWLYVRMGWIKLDPQGFWTPAFARWGYPPWLRVAVGLVEVAGGAMLVVPWTATLGGVAVACVMAGAWITRYLDGRFVDVAWISAYFLGLLWIAWEWRDFGPWKSPSSPAVTRESGARFPPHQDQGDRDQREVRAGTGKGLRR